jgi:hypothetical protein
VLCNIGQSCGYLSYRSNSITVVPALDIAAGHPDALNVKLPIALQHIELQSVSRFNLPVSDPFGSAFLVLRCCFSLWAFRRRNAL